MLPIACLLHARGHMLSNIVEFDVSVSTTGIAAERGEGRPHGGSTSVRKDEEEVGCLVCDVFTRRRYEGPPIW